jgi:hypothetical protein
VAFIEAFGAQMEQTDPTKWFSGVLKATLRKEPKSGDLAPLVMEPEENWVSVSVPFFKDDVLAKAFTQFPYSRSTYLAVQVKKGIELVSPSECWYQQEGGGNFLGYVVSANKESAQNGEPFLKIIANVSIKYTKNQAAVKQAGVSMGKFGKDGILIFQLWNSETEEEEPSLWVDDVLWLMDLAE